MPTIRSTGQTFQDNETQPNEHMLNRLNMDGYDENNYELEAQWRRGLEQERTLALELSNRRLQQENERLSRDIRLLSVAKRKAEAELDGERENSRIILEDMGKLFNYIALLETQVFHYKPKEREEKKPLKGKDKNSKTTNTQTVSVNRKTRSKILARPTPSFTRFSPLYQQLQEELEGTGENENENESTLPVQNYSEKSTVGTIQPTILTTNAQIQIQTQPQTQTQTQTSTTSFSSNENQLINSRYPPRRLGNPPPLNLAADEVDGGKRKRSRGSRSAYVGNSTPVLNGLGHTVHNTNASNAVSWVDVISQALQKIGDQASSREITEKVLEINPSLRSFKTLNQQVVTTLSTTGHFEKKCLFTGQGPSQTTKLVWTITNNNNNNNHNNNNNDNLHNLHNNNNAPNPSLQTSVSHVSPPCTTS